MRHHETNHAVPGTFTAQVDQIGTVPIASSPKASRLTVEEKGKASKFPAFVALQSAAPRNFLVPFVTGCCGSFSAGWFKILLAFVCLV